MLCIAHTIVEFFFPSQKIEALGLYASYGLAIAAAWGISRLAVSIIDEKKDSSIFLRLPFWVNLPILSIALLLLCCRIPTLETKALLSAICAAICTVLAVIVWVARNFLLQRAEQQEDQKLEAERDAAFAKIHNCSEETKLLIALCWKDKITRFRRSPESVIGRELDEECELAFKKQLHFQWLLIWRKEQHFEYVFPGWVTKRLEQLTDNYFSARGLGSKEDLANLSKKETDKLWKKLEGS